MIKTFPIVCASVAGNPSPLGVRMHNAGYEAEGLDYTYVAMGATDINEVVDLVKRVGIRGLGVSMPFKQDVINYLDYVDDSVKKIGACNTVVNEEGVLKGYNTDWVGAQEAIKEAIDISEIKSAVIIGAGGVARAIAYALKQNNITVYVSARKVEQREKLVKELGLDGSVDLNDQGKYDVDLVVNATPDATVTSPVNLESHAKAKAILDVVFTSYMTDLTTAAKNKGIKVAPGWRMLLLQGAKQCELYTGRKAPVNSMGKVLENWLSEK